MEYARGGAGELSVAVGLPSGKVYPHSAFWRGMAAAIVHFFAKGE